jgi:hypothetical protein
MDFRWVLGMAGLLYVLGLPLPDAMQLHLWVSGSTVGGLYKVGLGCFLLPFSPTFLHGFPYPFTGCC